MNVEQLGKKLEDLEQIITIHRNDLKRLIINLDKEFDLRESDIGNRIDKIEALIEKLKKKRRKIIRIVEKELEEN